MQDNSPLPKSPEKAKGVMAIVDVGLARVLAAAAADIYRSGAMVDAVLEARHGLETRLYTVLRLIDDGLLYPSQIADAMHMPRSVITRALHALADKRCIIRALDSDDTRRTRLALTDHGKAVLDAATRSFGEWLMPRFGSIATSDLDGFFRVVAAMTSPGTFGSDAGAGPIPQASATTSAGPAEDGKRGKRS